MSMRTPRLVGCLLGGVLCGILGSPARAQQSRTSTVTASVPSLGAVLATSPLTPGDRRPGGDLFVSGTVTTRHNGAYRLQVRLTAPFTVRQGSSMVTHQVQARTPDGGLLTLGVTEWVTVTTGPGGALQLNQVEYLVLWGDGGPRSPGTAVQLPLEYQVVPP